MNCFYTIESQIENDENIIRFCELLAEMEEEQKEKIMYVLGLCQYIVCDPNNIIVEPKKAMKKIIEMAGKYCE